MRWLVMLVVVVVVVVKGEVGDTRHHSDIPESHGENAQDFCNPILFKLGRSIENDIGSEYTLIGIAKTMQAIKTSRGKVVSKITLYDMKIMGLQDVQRFHAGNISDASIECAAQFQELDVKVNKYRAVIPRYGRVRTQWSEGSITAKVNLLLHFKVMRNAEGLPSVITAADTSVRDDDFSFTKPRYLRKPGMFEEVLRNAVESAVTENLETFFGNVLSAIVSNGNVGLDE